MAVMGRTKRANAQRWDAINKQREKENSQSEKKEETISKEEHEKRVKALRDAGIIK